MTHKERESLTETLIWHNSWAYPITNTDVVKAIVDFA
jgi:hypothetical protein